MELITRFALGDDIAYLLLGTALAALAILVVTVLRLRSAGSDGEPSPWLRSLLGSGIRLGLWVGVPVLGLSFLVVDALPDRMLRAAMILLGLALAGVSAWMGQRLLAGAVGNRSDDVDTAQDLVLAARVGGLQASAALALVALPGVVTIWLLREDSGTMLLGIAAGAAIIALALRIVAASAEASASAATLLAGSHELELDRDDVDNNAAAGLRDAELLRHGAGRSAVLVAVAAAALAAAVTVGLPTLAAEAILVAVLALGIAMLAPLVAMIIPRRAAAGGEAGAFRLSGLIPTLIAAAGAVAAVALWLPSQYKNLRFEAVGMGSISDPGISAEPVARADLLTDIETALEGGLAQFISSTDESAAATSFLDLLGQYSTHPSTLIAIAISVGAIAALCSQLLLSAHSAPLGGASRRVARTSRTGASLGTLSALATAALWAGLILAVLVLGLAVLAVTAAGGALLGLALSAAAGLGALITVSAHAGVHTAEVLVDRPGADPDWRTLVRGGSDESSAGLAAAVLFTGLSLIAPFSAAIAAAPRAATIWEDRALHSLAPTSLTTVGGIGLAVVGVLLISTFVLDAQRRLASAAVLEARTGYLEDDGPISLDGLGFDARRLGLVALATAVIMPLVAGFALGAAAVLAYVAAFLVLSVAIALWSHLAAGTMRSAVHLIQDGRYGGRGSWAHGGALSGTVLGTSLRSGLGEVLVPAALVSALTTYLGITMMVGTVVDGTNAYLRVGIAVIALLVGLCCWLFAVTAPEPDLEDGEGAVARPLFATRVEEDSESGLLSMSWDAEEETQSPSDPEDPKAAQDDEAAPAASSSSRRSRKRNRRRR